jgi:parallel beta-helix repeat protein
MLGGLWYAQSFKPTLNTLTKVELYIDRTGTPPDDLVVSIRDTPTGSDLTSISVPASMIPSSPDWVEFDLTDISVTPDSTYFIIMHTEGGDWSNHYLWSYAYNTAYVDGSLWRSSNSGSSWTEYVAYDFCFKTYGILMVKITFLLLIISSSGCVDNNLDISHKTIQESIDNAHDGDTIYIQNGTYYETLVINKSITLIGEGDDRTIIDCKTATANHVNIILINADNCTIKGLKITNTDVSSDVVGININSSNNSISNNAISRTNQGIHFHVYTKNNKIYGNNISDNQEGIYLPKTDNNNNIVANYIFLNSNAGILIHSLSQGNMISSNTIFKNKYGVIIKGGIENKIFNNNFTNNQRGAYMCCGAKNNTVYNNVFKQNSDYNARDNLNNNWHAGLVGNYWDDYTGVDKNGDNVGNMPYNISGDSGSQDMYPMMNPP